MDVESKFREYVNAYPNPPAPLVTLAEIENHALTSPYSSYLGLLFAEKWCVGNDVRLVVGFDDTSVSLTERIGTVDELLAYLQRHRDVAAPIDKRTLIELLAARAVVAPVAPPLTAGYFFGKNQDTILFDLDLPSHFGWVGDELEYIRGESPGAIQARITAASGRIAAQTSARGIKNVEITALGVTRGRPLVRRQTRMLSMGMSVLFHLQRTGHQSKDIPRSRSGTELTHKILTAEAIRIWGTNPMDATLGRSLAQVAGSMSNRVYQSLKSLPPVMFGMEIADFTLDGRERQVLSVSPKKIFRMDNQDSVRLLTIELRWFVKSIIVVTREIANQVGASIDTLFGGGSRLRLKDVAPSLVKKLSEIFEKLGSSLRSQLGDAGDIMTVTGDAYPAMVGLGGYPAGITMDQHIAALSEAMVSMPGGGYAVDDDDPLKSNVASPVIKTTKADYVTRQRKRGLNKIHGPISAELETRSNDAVNFDANRLINPTVLIESEDITFSSLAGRVPGIIDEKFRYRTSEPGTKTRPIGHTKQIASRVAVKRVSKLRDSVTKLSLLEFEKYGIGDASTDDSPLNSVKTRLEANNASRFDKTVSIVRGTVELKRNEMSTLAFDVDEDMRFTFAGRLPRKSTSNEKIEVLHDGGGCYPSFADCETDAYYIIHSSLFNTLSYNTLATGVHRGLMSPPGHCQRDFTGFKNELSLVDITQISREIPPSASYILDTRTPALLKGYGQFGITEGVIDQSESDVITSVTRTSIGEVYSTSFGETSGGARALIYDDDGHDFRMRDSSDWPMITRTGTVIDVPLPLIGLMSIRSTTLMLVAKVLTSRFVRFLFSAGGVDGAEDSSGTSYAASEELLLLGNAGLITMVGSTIWIDGRSQALFPGDPDRVRRLQTCIVGLFATISDVTMIDSPTDGDWNLLDLINGSTLGVNTKIETNLKMVLAESLQRGAYSIEDFHARGKIEIDFGRFHITSAILIVRDVYEDVANDVEEFYLPSGELLGVAEYLISVRGLSGKELVSDLANFDVNHKTVAERLLESTKVIRPPRRAPTAGGGPPPAGGGAPPAPGGGDGGSSPTPPSGGPSGGTGTQPPVGPTGKSKSFSKPRPVPRRRRDGSWRGGDPTLIGGLADLGNAVSQFITEIRTADRGERSFTELYHKYKAGTITQNDILAQIDEVTAEFGRAEQSLRIVEKGRSKTSDLSDLIPFLVDIVNEYGQRIPDFRPYTLPIESDQLTALFSTGRLALAETMGHIIRWRETIQADVVVVVPKEEDPTQLSVARRLIGDAIGDVVEAKERARKLADEFRSTVKGTSRGTAESAPPPAKFEPGAYVIAKEGVTADAGGYLSLTRGEVLRVFEIFEGGEMKVQDEDLNFGLVAGEKNFDEVSADDPRVKAYQLRRDQAHTREEVVTDEVVVEPEARLTSSFAREGGTALRPAFERPSGPDPRSDSPELRDFSEQPFTAGRGDLIEALGAVDGGVLTTEL
jgi:hypothetical protein